MAFTNPLMQLFGQSPFKPLQEHYAVVLKCANEVPALLAAAQKGDEPEIGSIRDEIFKLESEADDLKNELRSHLPRTMFLPVDRREVLMILELAMFQRPAFQTPAKPAASKHTSSGTDVA